MVRASVTKIKPYFLFSWSFNCSDFKAKGLKWRRYIMNARDNWLYVRQDEFPKKPFTARRSL